MDAIMDTYGWKYYDKLPAGFRHGHIRDFISGGRVKIGMIYLLHNYAGTQYEIHTVSMNTRSGNLIPFIKTGQLYVRA